MSTLAANPRRLGAEIGVVAVPHTWGQDDRRLQAIGDAGIHQATTCHAPFKRSYPWRKGTRPKNPKGMVMGKFFLVVVAIGIIALIGLAAFLIPL